MKMLRTINAAVRGEFVKGQLQKVIRVNSAARTLQTASSIFSGVSVSSKSTGHICSTKNRQLYTATTLSNNSSRLHRQQRLYSTDGFPPHTKVTLPALSPTMEEGTLVSWEKKEGDKLSEGDLLAEIETDKATMAMETPEEGFLAKILVPAGTKGVPIGKLVCIIVENESDVAKFRDFVDTEKVSTQAQAKSNEVSKDISKEEKSQVQVSQKAQQQPIQGMEQRATDIGRVYASPMARRLAEQKEIRLQGKGTGLYGSITSKDLNSLMGAPVPFGDKPSTAKQSPLKTQTILSAAYIDLPVSSIRTTIAKRLLQSKQQVPHYYLTSDIVMDRIAELRQRVNGRVGEKNRDKYTSVNDYVVKAVAVACQRVPEVNSAWMDSVIRQYSTVDISVAVSTERGLITPIVFNAQSLGVQAISQQIKALVAKARSGKLQPHEYQGGTISVSNLGMYGVTQFAAIINPPQAAILAVGAALKRGDHLIMSTTLSADHRVVDGAVGAQWLQTFRECLEDPESMIL